MGLSQHLVRNSIAAVAGAAVALGSIGVTASSPPTSPPSNGLAVSPDDVAAARAALPTLVSTTPPAADTPCAVITMDEINTALSASELPYQFTELFADPSPLDTPSTACGGAFEPLGAADTTTGGNIYVADFGDSVTFEQFVASASEGVEVSTIDTGDPTATVKGFCENLDVITQCFALWEAEGFVIAVQMQVVGDLDVATIGTTLAHQVVPAVVASVTGTAPATTASVAETAPGTGDAPFDAEAIVPETAPAPEFNSVP